ncbi:MAG TPA: glycosyl hydrolase, partial [Candidatus Polarisedimenticolia bacterium]|nr:glycosyl hydrolase [Candidatus Polarisedimenticolia bacterium]
EIYRVTVDRRFPYHVYGCQQDNTCLSIPSRTASSGIDRSDWYVIGGCESGHVAVDPRNPEVTYSGCYGGTIGRYDHATGQEREIMAYPQLAVGQAPRDLKYRFQWNAPVLLSPHDPAVLYHTSQYVHRTTDEGQTWSVISPDLTRNDPAKQETSGGPITRDNTGAEVYGTIFAFAESPQEEGVLWAGSDDGLVHLSRDHGATWRPVTPRKMPEWGQVNSIELSRHERGRAFLAVTRYKLDDFAPYIFRTDDYGATWDSLADGRNGIPAGHFVRVVREDPDRKGLLFAGTEFGLYVSLDDGRRWQPFRQNLPVTPISDLAIAHQDLIVATQGRSFWILDDLTPLHTLSREATEAVAHLFPPRPTVRFAGGSGFGASGAAGENPPTGVAIRYHLASAPKEDEELKLEILDESGELLRSLSSLKEEPSAPNPFARFMPPGTIPPRKLAAEEGTNRYVWNFRLADAEMVEDAVLWGSGVGPRVPPGSYQVRLSLRDWSATAPIRILPDPRLSVTAGDLAAQFELGRDVWQAISLSHRTLKRIRSIREQVDGLTKRLAEAGLGDGLTAAGATVLEQLATIEEAIHQKRNESSQDALNFPPKLDNQLVALLGVVESADAKPTGASRERYLELKAELDRLVGDLAGVESGPLAAFNQLVRSKQAPPVILPAAR